MVPNGEALLVGLESRAEPVRSEEKLPAAVGIPRAAPEVVVAKSVLRDGDRAVLQADLPVIVKLRNAVGVVRAVVVGLPGQGDVVFIAVYGAGIFAGRVIKMATG